MSGKEKKLNVRSILLITIVLPVVVIIISSIAIYITAASAGERQIFDISMLNSSPVEIEKAPEKSEDAVSLLNSLIDDAVASGILKYNGRTEVSINGVSTGNENLDAVLNFSAGSFAGKFSSFFEDSSIKYGEDATFISTLLPENVPDSFSAEINEGIITLVLEYTSVYDNMYYLTQDKTAISMFSVSNNTVFSTLNEKLINEKCVYTLTASCESGKIITLDIMREYDYSSRISFLNTLAGVGSYDFNMKPVFTEKYDFLYAGIEVEQDYITLTANGFEALTVVPYTEENLSEDEYKLEFISSDESIATVSENGQVDAVAISSQPVTITVKLTYLGRTFVDSCTVYVVKETESIRISDNELNLRTGDKHVLTAEVKPDDATVKTVEYFSSDENVVRVNSDGEITAVGNGSATVYAFTSQGFLTAECKVTVAD